MNKATETKMHELLRKRSLIDRSNGLLEALVEAQFHVAEVNGVLQGVVLVNDLRAIAVRLAEEAKA